MQAFADSYSDTQVNSANLSQPKFSLELKARPVRFYATEITSGTYTYTLANNRLHTTDALYDIIAMPYSNVAATFKDENGNTQVVDSQLNLDLITDLIKTLGTTSAGYAYDLQLLPYCPLEQFRMDLRSLTAEVSYLSIKQNNVTKSFILCVPKSNFSNQVLSPITLGRQITTSGGYVSYTIQPEE